ncbi:MAG: 3-deoxy-D-manno-octulosonic acid transferase [Fuerstiella sp.]|nr:3-deoxy-D-manno-octulosonic acid transferase [Fuerstiella sp.]
MTRLLKLLNIVYTGLLILLAPVILWRMLRHGRYRRGLQQKLLGRLPKLNGSQPVVWFHAVSVGEVLQLRKIVTDFRDATQNCCQVLITTSTDSGYDLAVRRFSDCTVSWFPLDFSWAVNQALARVQPDLVVLAELEFWPGFLNACRLRRIKTAVINARMSDRSYRGYSRVKPLIQPLMRHFSVVATQTQEYAQRLIALGTRPPCTVVTGSVKFDGVNTDRSNADTLALRKLFCLSDTETVLIAGSTQSPEEEMVIDAWRKLRSEYPGVRLILVPRHQERFNAVAELLSRRNLKYVRRTMLDDSRPRVPSDAVILMDTIGELGVCWGLSDVAYVGGSFGTRGGQNMLEPAAYGAAVLFGPNTWNFRDIVRMLISSDAAIEVTSTDDFETQVRQLLFDVRRRTELGAAARQLVLSQKGAIPHTVRLILKTLEAPDYERHSDHDSRGVAA